MKKKLIIIILLLFSYLNVNAECEDILTKIFIDKIHKVDEKGETLEGAVFELHDINNRVSFRYSDETSGRYSLNLFEKRQYCTPGGTWSSYKSERTPKIQKLSRSVSTEDAADTLSDLILAQFSSINYISEWNEQIPGYYRSGYTETTSGNQTTRKTNILYPMVLEEVSTPNGYIPADKYIIILSGIITNSYYSSGYIYEKSFKFDRFYYSWAPYFEYDENYNYSKMYTLDSTGWDDFYNRYLVDIDTEDNCFEDCSEELEQRASNGNIGGERVELLDCKNVCEDIHKIVNIKRNVYLELSNSINDNQEIEATKGETVQYKATINTNIPDTSTIQLHSTATSDEVTEGIDSKKVTIAIESSEEPTEQTEPTITQILFNPKTGSIMSLIVSLSTILLLFFGNYYYFKKQK